MCCTATLHFLHLQHAGLFMQQHFLFFIFYFFKNSGHLRFSLHRGDSWWLHPKDYECAAAPQHICLSHDLVADDRVSHPWRSHKTLSNWRNVSVSHNLKPGKNSSCDVHLVEPGTTVLCRISTLTRQLAARLCVTVDTPASSRDLQRPGGEALKDLLLVLSEMWSLSFGPMTSSEDESRTPLSL